MQSCASAAKLLGGGPILFVGIAVNQSVVRVTTTSDHQQRAIVKTVAADLVVASLVVLCETVKMLVAELRLLAPHQW